MRAQGAQLPLFWVKKKSQKKEKSQGMQKTAPLSLVQGLNPPLESFPKFLQ